MIENEGGRRVLHISGHLIFWPLLILVLGGMFWWTFLVPGPDERAMLCPKHEQREATYRALADVRPLRDYELAGWTVSEEYVREWCQ
jgi:hypothetical protein